MIGHEPTQGEYPWNIAINPSTRFFVTANQQYDSAVVFRIDSQTGKLPPVDHAVDVPKPMCLKFFV